MSPKTFEITGVLTSTLPMTVAGTESCSHKAELLHGKVLIPRFLFGLSMLVSSVVCGNSAHANSTHYDSFHQGQKAMGLGGAVTAVSGEAETSFYNPAGLTDIE